MEKLIKALDVHRTSFTRIYDSTMKAIQSPSPDTFELESNLQILEQKMEIIKDLDKKFVDLLLDSASVNTDIDSEMEKADQYVLQFNNLKLRVNNTLSSTNIQDENRHSICSHPDQYHRKMKLPQIEFKKFGGDIREWLPFWSQFKRIHEDELLADEDEFQYLIQATIPKSRARQIVDSYPPSRENYPKALDSLKSRFGRDDLLVEVYVRELLKLILSNLTNKPKLSFLYDKIETQLRALETLGVTSETCAAMLYPLIESCLPEEILRVWQRSSIFSVGDSLKNRLDHLMKFLKNEVENEERISLASTSFDLQKQQRKKEDCNPPYPSAHILVNTKTIRCVFCKQDHASDGCSEASKMTLLQRKKILSDKGCCHVCLKFGHVSRKCRTASFLKCKSCGGKHTTLMCSNVSELWPTPSITENLSNHSHNEVFLQTLMVQLKSANQSRRVRIIIDTGSQKSYISKHTANDMKLEKIGSENIVHALFGGCHSEVTHHDCYRVMLESVDKNYSCSLEVMDQPIICSDVVSIYDGPWSEELKELGIQIYDLENGPIDLLIGADVAGKLLSGPRHVLKCGLVAIKTKLGWTIMGKTKILPDTHSISNSMMITTLFSKSFTISDMWNLEVLGITDPVEQKSKTKHEIDIMNQFLDTVTRNNDGRYEISMPWIEGHPPLPNNFDMAKYRLDQLRKKLENDGYYDHYNQVLDEWLSEGIIEEVSTVDTRVAAYYLPHRHVLRLNSATTKLRPVFDASAKLKNNPSLNQCLEKGINLISLIPSVLIGFRLARIGVISDIRKAFLQISIREDERNFVRFLWYRKNGDLICYRHARVVFGVTSSPFLLGAVINHHLKKTLEENRFSRKNVLKLMKSFYVDNCVTSVDSKEDLETFMQESRGIMADAKFDLRGWEHSLNNDSLLNGSTTHILGLNWDRCSDTLKLCFDNFKDINTEKITKRVILSIINRVFDPLGFAVPVVLFPKLLLRKTWMVKLGWNEAVSEDISRDFLQWLNELNSLMNLNVPRWLQYNLDSFTKLSFHVFCDASQVSYATVIFLRAEFDNRVSIQLVQAKSRISPLKSISIPRLELLAATIGVRLLVSITESMDRSDVPVFYWTDSTTVLSWIKLGERWKPVVWNRIQEIRSLSKMESWYHVPGVMNPADLPSRGCTATQLLQSRWWEGPSWLYKEKNEWPTQEFEVDEHPVLEERRKNVIALFSSKNQNYSWIYRYFSKYQKIVNMIGWIKRFIFNCLNTSDRRKADLSAEEVEAAEIFLIRCVQQDTLFGDEENIYSLIPFQDQDGILRIKTKIIERDDFQEFRYPALLPKKHPVVHRLMFDTHVKLCHVGVQSLLSTLRERFWILGGRKTIKSVLSKCTICRKYDGKKCEVEPVTLPRDRVRDAAVFEVTGIDLFGHLYLRSKEKVWVCIFTCAIYRAVHLEMVSSLSTDSFLQAFRRFVARRGRPTTVYSDNATNFRGADNSFASLDWAEIAKVHTAEKITWKFNIPTAAWWGGWWERLIRLVKNLLRKVLGRACLTFEELSSILCDCESIINSRPLTYISEDDSDLVTLTPAMFLQDIKEIGVPDLDAIEANNLKKRFRYRHKVRDDLRRRFRKEYLGQLVSRKNNLRKDNLNVGDVVMVENDFTRRIDWPLAKIVQVFPGRDGKIRVARLKTDSGYILRPVQRLYPLEVDNQDDKIIGNSTLNRSQFQSQRANGKETVTRYGRKTKAPPRYGYQDD